MNDINQMREDIVHVSPLVSRHQEGLNDRKITGRWKEVYQRYVGRQLG